MFYFETRSQAREFSRKNDSYKLVDNGTNAEKRWAVKVL